LRWIGLTGGIASGKSTVSRILKEAGAWIIDADVLARAATKKGGAAYDAIVRDFGPDILDAAGEVDRKRLGAVVFGSAEARAHLNHLVHPHVLQMAKEERRAHAAVQPDALIVFDAALLIETGTHRQMDRVVVVYVDRATQVARLMRRDRLSCEDAERRIDSQMPLEEKVRVADDVIDNHPPEPDVAQAVLALYRKIKSV